MIAQFEFQAARRPLFARSSYDGGMRRRERYSFDEDVRQCIYRALEEQNIAASELHAERGEESVRIAMELVALRADPGAEPFLDEEPELERRLANVFGDIAHMGMTIEIMDDNGGWAKRVGFEVPAEAIDMLTGSDCGPLTVPLAG